MKAVTAACAAILSTGLMIQAAELLPNPDGANWTIDQKWKTTSSAWGDTTELGIYTYNANGTMSTAKIYANTPGTGADKWLLSSNGTATYTGTDKQPTVWATTTLSSVAGSWDTTTMTFTYNASKDPTNILVKMKMQIAAGVFARVEANADVWYNASGQQIGDSMRMRMIIPIMPNADTTFKPSKKTTYTYGTHYQNSLTSKWDTTAHAWVEDTRDSTVINNADREFVSISQSKVNGVWVNSKKDTSIYAAGKFAEQISMVWTSGAWVHDTRIVFMTTTPPFGTAVARRMIAQSTALANALRSSDRYAINGRVLPATFSKGILRTGSQLMCTRQASGGVVIK